MELMPTIDLGIWLKDFEDDLKYTTSISKEEVALKVKKACEETGFFALKIPNAMQTIIDDAATASKRFFLAMSDTEKRAFLAGPDNAYGYFPMESEALGYGADVDKKPDLREAFSMGPTCKMSERLKAVWIETEKGEETLGIKKTAHEKNMIHGEALENEMIQHIEKRNANVK